jgi:peptide/nickel transport system permease protein
MAAFLIRRLLSSVVVILGVMVVVFLVTHVIGDPALLLTPINAPRSQYLELRHNLGLDDPLTVQFFRFAGGAIHGDFGNSIWQRSPALGLVLERLPATFQLVAVAMVLSVLIALPLGILAALKPGTALDKLSTTISLFGVSVPSFWLGMMFILLLSVQLGWFKTSGYGGFSYIFLPALSLAMLAGGRITQIVRSSMIDELSRPYITTARSKGVLEIVVIAKHALKNAAIPILTLAGWELVRMLAGYTVAIEKVFEWPGVGLLAIDAIERHDFPLIQADVFVVAVMVVIVNILVDISYAVVDARVRLN